MNGLLRVGYEGAALLARALTAVAPASKNKLVDTFAARRGVIARFEAFGRDPARPLLWMHAPSVGEGLQARPVMDLVRDGIPDAQLAYTRSEERRVGKECLCWCRSRWSPYH